MTQFALAFLDCEFGGLDPARHDITEIGVIVTDYRLAELASAEWKVLARPDRITPEAAAIFGYDAERWAREGVPLRRALSELAALLPAGPHGDRRGAERPHGPALPGEGLPRL